GWPTSITAYQPPVTNQRSSSEDSIVTTCQFENGAVGIMAHSWGVRGASPLSFFAVHGSRGSVYCFNAGRFGLLNRHFPRPLIFPFRDWRGYEAMWRDFLRGLAGGNTERCLMTAEIGRRDLAFVEAACRSAEQSLDPTRSSARQSLAPPTR